MEDDAFRHSDSPLSIILLNWNTEQLTLECLRSLTRMDYSNLQIILVDNGSRDGTLTAIEAEFPRITLIRHSHNLGFTGGCNAGVRRALADGSDYIMLLNNDTEVAADMLQILVNFAESDPHIGIVGPLLYYYDDAVRIWSAGIYVDYATGQSHSLRDGELDDGAYLPYQVDAVCGCGLLVKRTVIEGIGLLDDRFFAYYEETDWCARARNAGYQIWIVPQAKVWHKINPQARSASPRYIYLITRNRLLFLKKAGSGWHGLFPVIVGYARMILAWSLLGKHRSHRPLRLAVVKGVVDFCRCRFGEPPRELG